MKRLLLILLMLGAVVIAVSYSRTGRLPWVDASPDEAQVESMRAAFTRIKEQWRQAGRSQALGVDASASAEDLQNRLTRLEADLSELAPRLKSVRAREEAAVLQRDISTFRSEMR